MQNKLKINELISIFNEVIFDIKTNIIAGDQLSGYKRYHHAIKDNKFLDKLQNYYKDLKSRYLPIIYNLIAKSGIGSQKEFAIACAFLLAKRINDANALAEINIIQKDAPSLRYIVYISITLKKEPGVTRWYIDAWDPGYAQVKTFPLLSKTYLKFLSNEYDYNIKYDFLKFEKLKEGESNSSITPDDKILEKNPWVSVDCTVSDAFKKHRIFKDVSEVKMMQKSHRQKELVFTHKHDKIMAENNKESFFRNFIQESKNLPISEIIPVKRYPVYILKHPEPTSLNKIPFQEERSNKI